jgi:hypothetical protein
MYTTKNPAINPWLVCMDGKAIARFRRRVEAEGYASTMRGLEPEAKIEIIFSDESPIII